MHRIQTDFEHLACERGDLVALQHDVIAVGLGNGRIVARTETGPTGNVVDVTLDNAMMMEAGKLYGIRARRIYGGAMRTDLYRVNTIAGETPRLYFASPPTVDNAPAVGDLVSFGIYDRETLRVIIRDIEPQQDLSCRSAPGACSTSSAASCRVASRRPSRSAVNRVAAAEASLRDNPPAVPNGVGASSATNSENDAGLSTGEGHDA